MNKLSDLTTKIVEVRKESRSKFVEKEKRLLKIKEVLGIIQDTSESSLWATIVSEMGFNKNGMNFKTSTTLSIINIRTSCQKLDYSI